MSAPQVEGYELIARIGSGAAAEVWSAVRRRDGLCCAVKLVRAADDPVGGEQVAEQALRELAILRRLDNPHIVTLHAAIPLADGAVALVLDLAEGGSLADLLSVRGHLSAGEAVTVLAPVARAVADLHAAGVVHGDLSPGNVLFSADGRPLVADLGVARVIGARHETVYGTTGFVAPELGSGGTPTTESDVYALGALGWFVLTGAPPSGPGGVGPGGVGPEGDGPAALSEMAPDVPSALVDLVGQCLRTEPSDRPPADRVAVTVFDAWPAEPVRLGDARDPTAQITHRIRARAAAQVPTPMPPGRFGRLHLPRSPTRSTSPRPGPVRRPSCSRPTHPPAPGSRPAPALPPPSRVPRPLLGVSVLLAMLLVVGATTAWWWSQRPGAVAATARADPSPTVTPAAAIAATKASPRSVPSSSTEAAPPSASRDAVRRQPTALVRELADARAAAWAARDVGLLGAVDVAGSPAMQQDRREIATVRAAAAVYRGFGFVVGPATVLAATGTSATIRASVGNTAYTLVGAHATTPGPARDPAAVTLHVRWTSHGWRIHSVG